MKCPSCKTSGAYVGLNQIECSNSECEFYVKEEKAVPYMDPNDTSYFPEEDLEEMARWLRFQYGLD